MSSDDTDAPHVGVSDPHAIDADADARLDGAAPAASATAQQDVNVQARGGGQSEAAAAADGATAAVVTEDAARVAAADAGDAGSADAEPDAASRAGTDVGDDTGTQAASLARAGVDTSATAAGAGTSSDGTASTAVDVDDAAVGEAAAGHDASGHPGIGGSESSGDDVAPQPPSAMAAPTPADGVAPGSDVDRSSSGDGDGSGGNANGGDNSDSSGGADGDAGSGGGRDGAGPGVAEAGASVADTSGADLPSGEDEEEVYVPSGSVDDSSSVGDGAQRVTQRVAHSSSSSDGSVDGPLDDIDVDGGAGEAGAGCGSDDNDGASDSAGATPTTPCVDPFRDSGLNPAVQRPMAPTSDVVVTVAQVLRAGHRPPALSEPSPKLATAPAGRRAVSEADVVLEDVDLGGGFATVDVGSGAGTAPAPPAAVERVRNDGGVKRRPSAGSVEGKAAEFHSAFRAASGASMGANTVASGSTHRRNGSDYMGALVDVSLDDVAGSRVGRSEHTAEFTATALPGMPWCVCPICAAHMWVVRGAHTTLVYVTPCCGASSSQVWTWARSAKLAGRDIGGDQGVAAQHTGGASERRHPAWLSRGGCQRAAGRRPHLRPSAEPDRPRRSPREHHLPHNYRRRRATGSRAVVACAVLLWPAAGWLRASAAAMRTNIRHGCGRRQRVSPECPQGRRHARATSDAAAQQRP